MTRLHKFTRNVWMFTAIAAFVALIIKVAGFDDAAIGSLVTVNLAGAVALLCTLALGFRSLVVER